MNKNNLPIILLHISYCVLIVALTVAAFFIVKFSTKGILWDDPVRVLHIQHQPHIESSSSYHQ